MDVPIKSVNFRKCLILTMAKGYHNRISTFVVKMIESMAINHGKNSTQRNACPIAVFVMVSIGVWSKVLRI